MAGSKSCYRGALASTAYLIWQIWDLRIHPSLLACSPYFVAQISYAGCPAALLQESRRRFSAVSGPNECAVYDTYLSN
jgi:hypothetical protein